MVVPRSTRGSLSNQFRRGEDMKRFWLLVVLLVIATALGSQWWIMGLLALLPLRQPEKEYTFSFSNRKD